MNDTSTRVLGSGRRYRAVLVLGGTFVYLQTILEH